MQELNDLEQAHLAEFNGFNSFWDSKMQEFNDEAENVTRNNMQN